jgi:hypothetical protein
MGWIPGYGSLYMVHPFISSPSFHLSKYLKKKFIEENFPNLKKVMSINIKEAYKTPNRLDQKRNFSHHIIFKTPNAQNKERILKAVREKRSSKI